MARIPPRGDRSVNLMHIISSFVAGGAEIYVRNLAIGLQHRGYKTTVIALDGFGQDDPRRYRFQQQFIAGLEARGVACGVVGSRARRDPLWAVKRCRAIIGEADPALIHAHLTFAAVFSCLSARGRPIVFTHHSTPVRSVAAHRFFLAKRLARYIAVSESGRAALLDTASIRADQVITIVNGIDLAAYRAAPQRADDGEPLTVIAVGRLSPPKNYPLLLHAMANVAASCRQRQTPVPRLRIVGEGPERRRLERLRDDLGLARDVEFLGLRDDVAALLRAADVYAMSSAWEGLSIALIEALAAGLPIVATDVGGNREVVEDGVCGFLTNPGDAADLAAKILRLAADRELRRRFSQQALLRARSFDIGRSLRAHDRLYRELTGSINA